MKNKRLEFNFQRLWNSEYSLIVERIIEMVKRHNPESLQLKRPYEALAAYKDDLAKIEKQVKVSGFTAELSELDNLRDRITSYLFTQIQSLKRLEIAPYSENAKILEQFFTSYGYNRNLIRENYTSQTDNTKKMLGAIAKDTAVQNAFDALHLTDLLTRLDKANTDFDTLFRTRNTELSQVPDVNIKNIRTEVDQALAKLFTAIEFCKEEYPDKDYLPLINELTELLNYHKAQIKARKGKKNNENKSQ